MPKTHATLLNEIDQELLDLTPTYITDAHKIQQLERAIRHISEKIPRVKKFSYFIESRTGTATSDVANTLTDTSESQFLTTDTDKVVFNKTDKKWANVASATTTALTLDWDAFPDGNEDYEIYNKGCVNKFQINLEDIEDYVENGKRGVIAVEYPVGTRRNFSVDKDILTIGVDNVADSKVEDPANDTEVLVFVEVRHYVSQMVLFAGQIDLVAGYAAGLKAIHVDTLDATGTFAEDTEFTIAGIRGTYTVAADATIATNECDLTIYPGLESAAADNDVLTILASTLTRDLEPIVVLLAAGYCLKAYALKPALTDMSATINTTANIGGPQVPSDYGNQATLLTNLGNGKIAEAMAQIERLRPASRSRQTYSRA